jgi:hypothetical protein
MVLQVCDHCRRQRVDAKLQINEAPVAMPYGAPPARRRIA